VAERRRRRLRATLISAALATALLTLAVLVAGCGGGTASDPLAGYWIGGAKTTPILVHVVKDGDTYSVRANPDTPLGATTKNGDALVIATHAVTMTFAPGAGDKLTVTLSGDAFKTKQQILTLQRVDETRYADAAVKYGLAAIRRGLMMWARGGGQKFPPPNEVNSNGLLGKMVMPWPVNMFSGQPMQPGDNKGDYTYTLMSGGRQFTLVGHLSDGSTTKGTP
jgi:hypothetical protein